MKKILLTGCAVIVAGATLSAQSRDERAHMQMAAELRILLQQQQELALSIASLAQSLTDTTKALNGRLDALDNSIRKAFADQGLAIGNIGTDVRGINERSRETITRLGELKEEIEELRKAMQQLLTRPVAAPFPIDPLDPNAPPPDVSQLPATSPPPVSPALGLTAKRYYDLGYGDYTAGNYAAAIRSWEEVLKSNATSEWADDAQLYIGEAEFSQNRFDQAGAAYSAVIQNYPKSDHVPQAYYKLGMANERLQRYDSARAAWQQLIKLFPNTDQAGLAKQGLGRIEKASGASQRP
jgi:tol-pal system protein YbgF